MSSSIRRAAFVLLLGGLGAQAQANSSDCATVPNGPASDLADVLGAAAQAGVKTAAKDAAKAAAKPRKIDTDGDGVTDDKDAFPNNYHESVDTDGDGVGDESDAFPNDPEETRDSDCDGVGDNADKKFDGEVTAHVNYPWSDGTYGYTSRFDLTTHEDGTMTATVNVFLDGKVDAKTLKTWEKATEEMWSERGLTVDVNWVAKAADAHSTVTVRAGSGRANAGTFFAEDDGPTVAHEIGHHMGLIDEYVDSGDPDRFIGEADSIMRVVWDTPKSYARHQELIMSLFDCP